jgi:hypothetical protein
MIYRKQIKCLSRYLLSNFEDVLFQEKGYRKKVASINYYISLRVSSLKLIPKF